MIGTAKNQGRLFTANSGSRQVSSALRTEMLKQVQMIEYGVGMSNQRLQPFLSSCHSEMNLLRISTRKKGSQENLTASLLTQASQAPPGQSRLRRGQFPTASGRKVAP